MHELDVHILPNVLPSLPSGPLANLNLPHVKKELGELVWLVEAQPFFSEVPHVHTTIIAFCLATVKRRATSGFNNMANLTLMNGFFLQATVQKLSLTSGLNNKLCTKRFNSQNIS